MFVEKVGDLCHVTQITNKYSINLVTENTGIDDNAIRFASHRLENPVIR